ncbi:MAG TPA: phosphodiester glycosidase family protein [Mycobacteriales bacterium]|nr:phosphodiester glycosidase family protein [Mycobacteriales bacterium]
MPRPRVLPVVAVAALAAVALPAPAYAAGPPGFRVVGRDVLATGVQHLTYVRDNPRAVAHVAVVKKGAGVRLDSVVSANRVAGPGGTLETTSAMCRRVRCLMAVNGDFATPGAGTPIGAAVAGEQPLRSIGALHQQMTVATTGAMTSTKPTWSGTYEGNDLADRRIHGVNVPRGNDQTVLYTSGFADTTQTDGSGAELLLRIVEPVGPIRLGQATLVEMTGFVAGGSVAIPAQGAVLSAHGAGILPLQRLWESAASGGSRHLLLRVSSNGSSRASVGASHVLVRAGRRWFASDGSTFAERRHPRTASGVTRDGTTLLVTVDGRQPGHSLGLTLAEMTELMVGLGAVEAVNHDGGGSSTFVMRGRVVNRPSDGRERLVTNSWVVVAGRGGSRPYKETLHAGTPFADEDPAAGEYVGGPPTAVDPVVLASIAGPDPVALGAGLATEQGGATTRVAAAALCLMAAAGVCYRVRRGPSPA